MVSVVYRDPRLLLPKRRNTTALFRGGKMEGEVLGWAVQMSPLRGAVCREREEYGVINRLRGASLVPGTPLHLGRGRPGSLY